MQIFEISYCRMYDISFYIVCDTVREIISEGYARPRHESALQYCISKCKRKKAK